MRTIIFLLFTLSLLNINLVYSQDRDVHEKLFSLSSLTAGWIEGYSESAGLNDFNYHSLREEITGSMLTRCTDGNMTIKWKSASVPDIYEDKGVGIIWIAAMDVTDEIHQFDFLVNGEKRFEIETGGDLEWTITSRDGGVLKFYPIESDRHGDTHGYMTLWAPENWIKPGYPVEISITGSADDSNTWIIIYKANDALSYLNNSVNYNLWYNIDFVANNKGYDATVEVPLFLEGAVWEYRAGEENGKISFNKAEGKVSGSFTISSQVLDNEFIISDGSGAVLSISSLGAPEEEMKFLAKTVIRSLTVETGTTTFGIKGERVYNPAMGEGLINLSESGVGRGNIYLMNSSHQDIAWMDSPEKCVIERDTMLLKPLFDRALIDPDYRFDVEDALMLREYLERHPDSENVIRKLLSEGRLSCGSTYIQPYEEMYSGESLARQFYLGAGWLKRKFDYDANTYWNVDVPGRTLQMPQLMKKAGTDYLVLSRFERGLFRWYSPDGSYITAFSPGHYGSAYGALQGNFLEASRYIATNSLFWRKYSENQSAPVIPLLSDWDMSPARDYSSLISKWNSIKSIENEEGYEFDINLPHIETVTTPEFFSEVSARAGNIPEITGERPAVWLYIHGPSHYEALKYSREADILLTMAEKFSTALALYRGSFKNYPDVQLNRAWEAKIYPDHGWGGKNGAITDNLFLQKFTEAHNIASTLLNDAIGDIAASVKTDYKKGYPVVVFNSLSWSRNDIVTVSLQFDRGETTGVKISDDRGKIIDSQITNCLYYNDGSLKRADIIFLATGVPSIGYSTYYYKVISEELTSNNLGAGVESLENKYFALKLDERGITELIDKESGESIMGAGGFAGGEVFTMRSVGNGAGEFGDIQQPDMEGFDFTGSIGNGQMWEVIERGDVFVKVKIRQPVKHAVVERVITLYNEIKKIDIDISLLNWEGVLYREFRMALPVNIKDGVISYEVPFGVVEVGKDELQGAAGERYTTNCSEIHPRGIENWIGVSNDNYGLTLSSSVAVVDYIDPRDNPQDNVILQPLLLSSRKSCHGEGNDFLQTGDHHYHFSFTLHKPGWLNGYRFGKEANENLKAIPVYHSFHNASLPLKQSFFDIDGGNIIISAVKKAEEGESVIIRAYEIAGNRSEVVLKSPFLFKSIQSVSLIEVPTSEEVNILKGIKLQFNNNAIETFRLLIR